jgi:Ca2+-transporting ATPase
VMAYWRGFPETEARALAFFSLVTAVLALIFVNRSFNASVLAGLRPNRALTFVMAAVAGILGLTLAWPLAAELFRFGPLHADDLGLTVLAGLVVLVLLECLKPWWAARLKG